MVIICKHWQCDGKERNNGSTHIGVAKPWCAAVESKTNYPRFFNVRNNYNYDEKLNWTDKQRYFCNKLCYLLSIAIDLSWLTIKRECVNVQWSIVITIEFRTQKIKDFLKWPDNTIIADFFPCAYLCSQSGVTRDPYNKWPGVVLANQEWLFSQPCTMGFSDRSEKSNSAWQRKVHWLSLIEHATSTNHDSGFYHEV